MTEKRIAMWSIVLYILSSLMCLYGIVTLYTAWRFRLKNIGLDLGAATFLAGAVAAATLEKWWPLVAAFIMAWIVRLLGGDPGYFTVMNPIRIMKAGRMMRRIQAGAAKVRVATFARLKKRYKPQYGSQAPALATAITNTLFADKSPDGSPAKVIIQTQKGTIEKELVNLRSDEELLTMVHITLSQEIPIRHAYGSTAEQIEEAFDELKQHGLLVPTEGVTTDKFLRLANEFYDNNVLE